MNTAVSTFQDSTFQDSTVAKPNYHWQFSTNKAGLLFQFKITFYSIPTFPYYRNNFQDHHFVGVDNQLRIFKVQHIFKHFVSCTLV